MADATDAVCESLTAELDEGNAEKGQPGGHVDQARIRRACARSWPPSAKTPIAKGCAKRPPASPACMPSCSAACTMTPGIT